MKSDRELEKNNPALYKIAREGGTERPGSSDLLYADPSGVFRCAVCGAALFKGDTKFDSGTGWPSFTDPVSKDAVELREDTSHGMRRMEVRCAQCGAHLGHVFPDGPAVADGTSKRHDRYCINGVCLIQEDE